jgi:hypothetical protein
MAKTTSLVTGNSKARKPGKGSRFLLTQLEADRAGFVGSTFADLDARADLSYATVAEEIRDILEPMAGKVDAAVVERWNHVRAAFMEGYGKVKESTDLAAERAWQRLVKALQLDKPQTPEAARKAAERAAKKAAEAPAEDGEASEADDASPMDGAGAQAAAKVVLELSAMEAHLIALVRAGKAELAAQCVADMVAK